MRGVLLLVLVLTTMAEAQEVQEVWIVHDEPPAPVRVELSGAVLRAGGAVGVAAVAAFALSRRRREQDPLEAAYDRVASRLGLDGDDRAVIRELRARAAGAAPVALLMSESALQRELVRARRRTIDPGRRARLNRVEAKVLG